MLELNNISAIGVFGDVGAVRLRVDVLRGAGDTCR